MVFILSKSVYRSGGCSQKSSASSRGSLNSRIFEDLSDPSRLADQLSVHCAGSAAHTVNRKMHQSNNQSTTGELEANDDTTKAGYVDTREIYDLLKPIRNSQRPVDEWNHLVLTCSGSKVFVALNGEAVNLLSLAEFDKLGSRPDGTPHKFAFAHEDSSQSGYIGLQDRSADIWFKNIKLLPFNY